MKQTTFFNNVVALNKTLLCLCLLFIAFSHLIPALYALEQRADWLDEEIDSYLLARTKNPEESYLKLIAQLAHIDANTNPDSVIRFYKTITYFYLHAEQQEKLEHSLQRLLEFANAQRSSDKRLEALNIKMDVLLTQKRMSELFQLTVEVERYLDDELHPQTRYLTHILLGRIYRQVNDFETAGKHFFQALDAVYEIDDDKTLIRSTFLLGQLALLHADMKNWEAAEELIERLLTNAVHIADKGLKAEYLLVKGYIFDEQKKHADAIIVFQDALTLSEEIDNEELILLSLNNVGASYLRLQDYITALKPLLHAERLALKLEKHEVYNLVAFNIALIEITQGNIEQGLARKRLSMDYFRQHSRRSDLERYLGDYAEVLNSLGYFQEEVSILREQRTLHKDLFINEKDNTFNEMQLRLQAHEQAYRIQLLEKENKLHEHLLENKLLENRLTSLAASSVAVVGLCILIFLIKAHFTNIRLKKANEQLEYMSSHDPLTGLFNRRSFQQKMADRKSYLKQHPNRSYNEVDAFILLDLDFFKRINDLYGHAVGDDILIDVSKRLTQSLRTQDMAIRWGGEEFLLFINRVNAEDLPTLVARILNTLSEQPITSGNETLSVSATCGFITLPLAGIEEHQLSWEQALKLADAALYKGKNNGRNQACGLVKLNTPFTCLTEDIADDVTKAIESGQIELTTIFGNVPPDVQLTRVAEGILTH